MFRKSPLKTFLRKLACSFSLVIAQSFIYPLSAGGGRIVVDRNDKLARTLFLKGNYESEVGAALIKFLRPGMTFLDVGANVGFFSIIGSRLVGSKGAVHSFEPDPRNFRRLARNVAVNNVSNIILNRMALMEKEGSIALRMLTEDGWGLYSSVGEPLIGVAEPRKLSGKTVTQRVVSSTLDKYVWEKKVKRIDLVKIDVEGTELSVLKGGERLLGGKNGPILIIEFNRLTTSVLGYDLCTLKEYVESLGYTLHRITDGSGSLTELGNVSNISRYENLVAVKSMRS
jgi:FkbM family methyltransferase